MAIKIVQRVKPLAPPEWQRQLILSGGTGLTAIDGTTVKLDAQEIVTSSDERRLWRGDGTYLSGTVDHGTVAAETAMATIYLQSSCTRGVHPGDTCWRSDLGVECRCISGHNATAVWRPVSSSGSAAAVAWGGINGTLASQSDLVAALNGKASTSHTHPRSEISDASLAGRNLLGVATPSTNKLPRIDADGSITLIDVPSVNSSGGGYLGDFATVTALLAAGATVGQTASVLAAGKMFLCTAVPSDVRSAWVYWSAASANLGRYWRWNITAIPDSYLEVYEVRYRCAGTWYPTSPMTSANQPSPLVCTESSYYSSSYLGWHAFDGTDNIWHTANKSTAWLTLDMGAGNTLVPDAIGIRLVLSNANRIPRDFSVRISPTGAFAGEEVILYSTTGETAWSPNVERVFTWNA